MSNKSFDSITAQIMDDAGNTVSGLDLSGMDPPKDGHAIANQLWAIAAYLKRRNQ